MIPRAGLKQLLPFVDGIFLVQWRGGEFQEVKELNFKKKEPKMAMKKKPVKKLAKVVKPKKMLKSLVKEKMPEAAMKGMKSCR